MKARQEVVALVVLILAAVTTTVIVVGALAPGEPPREISTCAASHAVVMQHLLCTPTDAGVQTTAGHCEMVPYTVTVCELYKPMPNPAWAKWREQHNTDDPVRESTR